MTPCDACAAPCCRNYHIDIDPWDAYRLASALKLPIERFAELKGRRAPNHQYRIVLDGAAPAEGRDHYTLSLAKVPDPDPQYEHRCVFLLTVGGVGRCGVYSIRPGVCRVYPASFHEGIIGVDGGGRYCPPGAWTMASFDVEGYRERWQEHRLHRWVNQELVDGWNERLLAERWVRTAEDYYRFLMMVYGELEQSAEELFAPRSPGAVAWPIDRVREGVDGALRAIGWRTDETVRFKDALLGWVQGASTSLVAHSNDVLVLDPDEEIDPEGAHLVRLLRRDSV